MKKRMLITATDLMAVQFLLPHMKQLTESGWQLELACSEVGGRFSELAAALPAGVRLHKVSLRRSPLALGNVRGLLQLRKLIAPEKYDVIWTNEPVMGVMTRLAARRARKAGTKVVYMCHGFHFFRGSSPVGWLFFPVERWMSRYTDVLVTVNREDEARGRQFSAGCVTRIHGVGVNTQRLIANMPPHELRQKLGIPEDAFLVLSVGELNKNKNHAVILRALAKLRDPSIHYMICGTGSLRNSLESLARRLKLEQQVHFPGYCRGIGDYLQAADVFAFPSKREGLSLAVLEAMSCGLPLVASDIRGVHDYAIPEKSGFLCHPRDVDGFARGISKLRKDPQLRRLSGEYNRTTAAVCQLDKAKAEINTLFEGIWNGN